MIYGDKKTKKMHSIRIRHYIRIRTIYCPTEKKICFWFDQITFFAHYHKTSLVCLYIIQNTKKHTGRLYNTPLRAAITKKQTLSNNNKLLKNICILDFIIPLKFLISYHSECHTQIIKNHF